MKKPEQADMEILDAHFDPKPEQAPSPEDSVAIWNKVTVLEKKIATKAPLLESNNTAIRKAIEEEIDGYRKEILELDEQLPKA